jgi:nitrile hydratase
MAALPLEHVAGLIATGATARMSDAAMARFKPGQRVHVRNLNPTTHTRLPRYVRGKTGTVEADRGVFCFNDTNAHGQGHKPQHVYSVCFNARDLWGEQAAAGDTLRLDLFDDYLAPDAH